MTVNDTKITKKIIENVTEMNFMIFCLGVCELYIKIK